MNEREPARLRKVVIADDDVNIVAALARYLRVCGIRVHVAHNGDELVQTLTSNVDVDLVLSDISMPGRSGIEAARLLRDRGMNTPFVFMTAAPEPHVLQQVSELSGREVLLKPFSLAKLDDVLTSLQAPQWTVA